MAVVTAGSPASAAPAALRPAEDLQTLVDRTVEANPGSQQIAENVIQLDKGITLTLPTEGQTARGLAQQCPRGWQCAWPHVNFEGAMLAAQRCVYLDYFDWEFSDDGGVTWDDFAYDVTSVYNNLQGVTWSQFWSPVNGQNYNAFEGAPASYVGAKWNDTFTAAQGCSGAAQ
jgi:hypothetical protein